MYVGADFNLQFIVWIVYFDLSHFRWMLSSELGLAKGEKSNRTKDRAENEKGERKNVLTFKSYIYPVHSRVKYMGVKWKRCKTNDLNITENRRSISALRLRCATQIRADDMILMNKKKHYTQTLRTKKLNWRLNEVSKMHAQYEGLEYDEQLYENRLQCQCWKRSNSSSCSSICKWYKYVAHRVYEIVNQKHSSVI